MDESKLGNALELITRLNASTHHSEITKEWHALYTTIDTLSETEVKSTHHLINQMRYPKSKKQDQILSTHLQNKAAKFITSSIYNQTFNKYDLKTHLNMNQEL